VVVVDDDSDATAASAWRTSFRSVSSLIEFTLSRESGLYNGDDRAALEADDEDAFRRLPLIFTEDAIEEVGDSIVGGVEEDVRGAAIG